MAEHNQLDLAGACRALGLEAPSFQHTACCVAGQTRFLCNVHLERKGSAVPGEDSPEDWVQGEGETPAEAEQKAVELALGLLKEQLQAEGKGLPAPGDQQRGPRLLPSLWQCVHQLLDSQKGQDRELQVYLLDAQQHLDGWLPLGALAQAKVIQHWAKERLDPAVLGDRAQLVLLIRAILMLTRKELPVEEVARASFVLRQDGLAVRIKAPIMPPTLPVMLGQEGAPLGQEAVGPQTAAATAGPPAERAVPHHLPLSPAEASAIMRKRNAGLYDEAEHRVEAVVAQHAQQLASALGHHLAAPAPPHPHPNAATSRDEPPRTRDRHHAAATSRDDTRARQPGQQGADVSGNSRVNPPPQAHAPALQHNRSVTSDTAAEVISGKQDVTSFGSSASELERVLSGPDATTTVVSVSGSIDSGGRVFEGGSIGEQGGSKSASQQVSKTTTVSPVRGPRREQGQEEEEEEEVLGRQTSHVDWEQQPVMGVLVPADSSLPVRPVPLVPGPSLLTAVAQCLATHCSHDPTAPAAPAPGVDLAGVVSRLVLWGRVGVRSHRVAPPPHPPHSAASPPHPPHSAVVPPHPPHPAAPQSAAEEQLPTWLPSVVPDEVAMPPPPGKPPANKHAQRMQSGVMPSTALPAGQQPASGMPAAGGTATVGPVPAPQHPPLQVDVAGPQLSTPLPHQPQQAPPDTSTAYWSSRFAADASITTPSPLTVSQLTTFGSPFGDASAPGTRLEAHPDSQEQQQQQPEPSTISQQQSAGSVLPGPSLAAQGGVAQGQGPMAQGEGPPCKIVKVADADVGSQPEEARLLHVVAQHPGVTTTSPPPVGAAGTRSTPRRRSRDETAFVQGSGEAVVGVQGLSQGFVQGWGGGGVLRVDSVKTVVMHKGPYTIDWDPDATEVCSPAAPPLPPEAGRRAQPAQYGKLTDAGNQHGGHVIEVPQPSMYGLLPVPTHGSLAPAPQPSPNARASWVAGAPVRDDVLLTCCRPTEAQTGVIAVRWTGFSVGDWWRCVGDLMPSRMYSRARHAPMLTRLPTCFRGLACWSGPLPTQLLERYCQRTATWLAALDQQQTALAAAAAATQPPAAHPAGAPHAPHTSAAGHPSTATAGAAPVAATRDLSPAAAGPLQAGGGAMVAPDQGLPVATSTADQVGRPTATSNEQVGMQQGVPPTATQETVDIQQGMPPTTAKEQGGMQVQIMALADVEGAPSPVTAADLGPSPVGTSPIPVGIIPVLIQAATPAGLVAEGPAPSRTSISPAGLPGGLSRAATSISPAGVNQVLPPPSPQVLGGPGWQVVSTLPGGPQQPQQLPSYECRLVDVEQPSEVVVTVTARAMDGQMVHGTSGTASHPAVGDQRAALAALQALQTLDKTLLLPTAHRQEAAAVCTAELIASLPPGPPGKASLVQPPACLGQVSALRFAAEAKSKGEAAVMSGVIGSEAQEADDGSASAKGACQVVKVSYRLGVDQGPGVPVYVMEQQTATFVLGCGMLPPEVDHQLQVMQEDHHAVISPLLVALDGAEDPLGVHPRLPASLHLHLLDTHTSVPHPHRTTSLLSAAATTNHAATTTLHDSVAALVAADAAAAPVAAGTVDSAAGAAAAAGWGLGTSQTSVLGSPVGRSDGGGGSVAGVTPGLGGTAGLTREMATRHLAANVRDLFGHQTLNQQKVEGVLHVLREEASAWPPELKATMTLVDVASHMGSTFLQQLLTTYLPSLTEAGPPLTHIIGVSRATQPANALLAHVMHVLQQQQQPTAAPAVTTVPPTAMQATPGLVTPEEPVMAVESVMPEDLEGMVVELTTADEPVGMAVESVAPVEPEGMAVESVAPGEPAAMSVESIAPSGVPAEGALDLALWVGDPFTPAAAVEGQLVAAVSGSCAGQSGGCCVTLVDVLQQLTEEECRQVGPSILGTLRPEVLVVTTPCADYNPVIRAAMAMQLADRLADKASMMAMAPGSCMIKPADDDVAMEEDTPQPLDVRAAPLDLDLLACVDACWPGQPAGPSGARMRSAANRFEWTEHDFQAWARELANSYGYTVSFQGVGHVMDEGHVLRGMADTYQHAFMQPEGPAGPAAHAGGMAPEGRAAAAHAGGGGSGPVGAAAGAHTGAHTGGGGVPVGAVASVGLQPPPPAGCAATQVAVFTRTPATSLDDDREAGVLLPVLYPTPVAPGVHPAGWHCLLPATRLVSNSTVSNQDTPQQDVQFL